MNPYQTFQQQFPNAQLNQAQEKHYFYGPDGKLLDGPPPGFAFEGSGGGGGGGGPNPGMNPGGEIPRDFAIEGTLDYGQLRSIKLIDNTKQFPRLPEYLHSELLTHYKQYRKCYVRIVSRAGHIHVHATPILEGERGGGTDVEYIPVYLDENDRVIGRPDQRRLGPILDRPPDDYYPEPQIGDRIPPPLHREFYHEPLDEPRRGFGPHTISDRYPLYDRDPVTIERTVFRDPVDRESLYRTPYTDGGRSPSPSRYRTGDSRRTVIRDRGPRRIERPGTDY